MKLKLFLLFVIICTNSWLQSTTWHIKQDGSGDFITIQEGIDASVDADTVLVYPGRYYENINYNGQNITVASLELITGDESYIGNTIIDGNQQGTCVCFDSEENGAILRGFSITNGIGDIMYGEINRLGGGILVFTHFQSLTINVYIINSRIYENRAVLGGGIFVDESNVTFSGVSIYNNYACSGGGISVVEESNITFDPSNLCNLYNNFAGLALDISVSDAINDIYVIVDTFSVQDQFEYFAFYQHSYTSSGNITINSQNHYIERINSDFYISTTGDDCNSGLTPEEPIRSIALALQKIESDSLNPKTVFVESGIYSYELNNQILPLAGKSFVNIIGENMETTIINNDLTAYTFMMVNKVQNSLRNFTLVSEEQCLEASIYILESNNIEIENLKVENSNIYLSGSVYFYRCFNVVIDNLIVQNNVSDGGSGFWFDGGNAIIRNSVFNNNDSNGLHPFVSNFYFKSNDYLELENCVFSNSNIEPTTEEFPTISIGAQQDCEPIIKLSNCLFSNNSTIKSYIAIITSSGSREINNCTFSENTSSFATLRIHSEVDFRNNIMYNNNVDYEILTGNITATGLNSILNIEYCDIAGGEDGIWPGNNPATINWLDGNIDEDPMFDSLGTYPFALLANSPCIDTGTPDTTGLYLPPWDLLHNYRVWDGDGNGTAIIDMGCYEFGAEQYVEVENILYSILNIKLSNYPNPFNPLTTINYSIAKEGKVELTIYNIKGQRVKKLVQETKEPGNYQVVWDGTDNSKKQVSSGIYFYMLTSGKKTLNKKMLLLK